MGTIFTILGMLWIIGSYIVAFFKIRQLTTDKDDAGLLFIFAPLTMFIWGFFAGVSKIGEIVTR